MQRIQTTRPSRPHPLPEPDTRTPSGRPLPY